MATLWIIPGISILWQITARADCEVIRLIILCIILFKISFSFSVLCSKFHALFSKLFSKSLSKQSSNSWNDFSLQCVTTVLEQYNTTQYCNNVQAYLLCHANGQMHVYLIALSIFCRIPIQASQDGYMLH